MYVSICPMCISKTDSVMLRQGAGHIADYLLDVYGKDGFALLVDEGGHYEEHDDVIIAFPNTAEKGKLNVQIEVSFAGSAT